MSKDLFFELRSKEVAELAKSVKRNDIINYTYLKNEQSIRDNQ